MEKIKRIEIKIITNTEEEKMEVGNYIHKQLVGNQDYIDCNIILNIDNPCTVSLYVFEECKEFPAIRFHKEEV